ncbi:MAG: hypothetical protein AAF802_10530 [Planctomycetota bacterium]
MNSTRSSNAQIVDREADTLRGELVRSLNPNWFSTLFRPFVSKSSIKSSLLLAASLLVLSIGAVVILRENQYGNPDIMTPGQYLRCGGWKR